MGIVGNYHFPTGTWGTTIDRDVMKAAYAGCDFESVDQKPHTAIDFAALDRFVRAHHRTALDLADEQGRVEYDLYPHHVRSEEHTSELQSLMRISYAVFCLKKKNKQTTNEHYNNT